MKKLFDLFSRQWGGFLKVCMALVVGVNLLVASPSQSTLAAGNNCKTSGPASGAYTLTVCITAPADGATVSGTKTTTATISTTGTNPGVSKLIFYLGGEYLITDYQSTYTFALPTTKWVDGTRLLEVEAMMKDGFISQRASITLNFSNGVTQPPVNNKTFTPRVGTAPLAGQAFILAAAGDGADGATYAGNVTDMIASWNPNLFLYLGDVYEDGTATEFRNWYGSATTFYGRFRSITNPVIGNHEYASGGVAPGYFDYWDNVPRYYSYDAAGWHFIALDSNCGLVPTCAVGQAQYQWLQNDLISHPNVCTIAYFHHPVFNVGPEGYSTRMNDMWALLAQYGVDIVLNGHDHNYQRWKPLNGSGVVSANGITEFVAGAGGHGTQQFITSDSRLVVGFDTTPNALGALRFQLNQYGAGFQYVNIAGTILDSGSIPCSGAPTDTSAPSKPTGLSATASTPQSVQLTWNASTDNIGVTGYSIYRGGVLLANAGPGTTYTDTTVQPGTAYSYQVRAQDAAGNASSLSTAAAVTTPLLLFSDDFESGSLSQWTGVTGLTVQQQQVYAGLYASRGTSSGTAKYAYKQLSQTQNDLYYRLLFKIINQGANSVYLQRFRTSTNGAIMGVFVSNTGKLAYRNDVTGITTTSTTVATSGAWHELQVHVQINGAAGATEVWLDGVRINDLSKTENLGTSAIGRIQLGDSSTGRTFDMALDDVAVSTVFIGSGSQPGSTPTPTSTVAPPPTNTATPTLTPIPTGTSARVGPGMYDDTNASWTYTGSWAIYSGGGPYNSTLHYTSTIGDTAELLFTGTKFSLLFTKDFNRGAIDVYVDGKKVTTVNAYSASYMFQQSYTSPSYAQGNHRVRLVHAGGGSYIDIDAIQIYGSVSAVPAGTYDDTNSSWTYGGNWAPYTGGGPYNGTLHYTSTVGDYAELVFSGTSFSFIFTMDSNRGLIDVYVDGNKIATVNAYSASYIFQQSYTSPTLTNTKHTVRFVHAGQGAYIDIDAITIGTP